MSSAAIDARDIFNSPVTQVQRAHPLFKKSLHTLRALVNRVKDEKVATPVLSLLKAHNGERMGAMLEVQRRLVRSMHFLGVFGFLNGFVEVCLDLI